VNRNRIELWNLSQYPALLVITAAVLLLLFLLLLLPFLFLLLLLLLLVLLSLLLLLFIAVAAAVIAADDDFAAAAAGYCCFFYCCCCFRERTRLATANTFTDLLLWASKACCRCTNSIHELPVTDLYRWIWGRWRISESATANGDQVFEGWASKLIGYWYSRNMCPIEDDVIASRLSEGPISLHHLEFHDRTVYGTFFKQNI